MGIFKALIGAISGVAKDAWKDFFTCDSLPADTLLVKGKRMTNNNNNTGDPNVITNGSVFTVADGQAAIVVDQGEVVYSCSDPGEHEYHGRDNSLFEKGGLKSAAKEVGRRITFGGDIPHVERLYYINTKLITGGSFQVVRMPFRFVDSNLNSDMDCTLECAGTYTFRIAQPEKFYKIITGNVLSSYRASEIISVMNSEFTSVLQTNFAQNASEGLRTYEVPGLIPKLQTDIREACSAAWMERYGIKLENIAFTTFSVNGNDRTTIARLQQIAVLKDPAMAAASLAASQSDAMVAAAKNEKNKGNKAE